MKKILYIDMDGVLVDFDIAINKLDADFAEKYKGRYDEVPHIFSIMEPMPGAIEAFNILAEKYDTYILSSVPWNNLTAASDKINWVKEYIGKAAHKRIILSHHKHLNIGDYLIDDRTKNGAGEFRGQHIHFGTERFPDWKTVMEFLDGT